MAELKFLDFDGLSTFKTLLENELTVTIKSVSVTIPVSEWVSDTNYEAYPYSCAVSVDNVTESAYIDCVILPDSMSTVYDCTMCPTMKTADGSLTFYAESIPAEDISIVCWVITV